MPVRFHDDHPRDEAVRAFLAVAIASATFLALFVFGLPNRGGNIGGGDAWSYYELAQTVFGDFYRINTLRQFDAPGNDYGNSFPPLWPVLEALVLLAAPGIGLYAGYALNLLCGALLLGATVRLSRSLGMPVWVGCLAFLAVLASPMARFELLSARPSILSLLLLVVIAGRWLDARALRWREGLTLGLLAGLAGLNRFDFWPSGVFLGALLSVRAQWEEPESAQPGQAQACYYAAFLLALSPWAVYSYLQFGKPFATDNARVVLMNVADTVTSYYPERSRVATLGNDPGGWVVGLFTTKLRLLAQNFTLSLLGSAVPFLFMVVLSVGRRDSAYLPRPAHSIKLRLIGFLTFGCLCAPYLLTGYAEFRHFLPQVTALVFVLTREVWAETSGRQWGVVRPVALLATAAAVVLWSSGLPRWSELLRPGIDRSLLHATAEERALTAAVRGDSAGQPHRLLIVPANKALRYGALTREPTSHFPILHGAPLSAFVRDYQITHVYDPDRRVVGADAGALYFSAVGPHGLYRVAPSPGGERRGTKPTPGAGESAETSS